MEVGPNHYQLLSVDRTSSDMMIKKAYRSMSLEYHPDKNRAATATEDFNRIKLAYETLIDKEKRREYNRLGDAGVALSEKTVIDLRYLIIQLVVYYGTSLIFAFMMTFSEPTGDAFLYSVFGLLFMLLMEMIMVVKEVPVPLWFLPQTTSFEIISVLRRLFPAFMNGCRCITGAFYIDHKKNREAALEALTTATKALTMRLSVAVQSVQNLVSNSTDIEESDGVVASHLTELKRRLKMSSSKETESVITAISKKTALLKDPVALKKAAKNEDRTTFTIVRNLFLYLIARFVFFGMFSATK